MRESMASAHIVSGREGNPVVLDSASMVQKVG